MKIHAWDSDQIESQAERGERIGMKEKEEAAKIIVIDDEESVRKSLKAVLEDKGYVVDTAENGQEAIMKCKTKFYNLALIDIRLPDMDGVKLLSAIGEGTPRMVKIIITGYPSLDSAIDAVNKGADGYVVKPFTMPKLLHTIQEHLQEQRETKKYSEEKVKEYIESRAMELETRTSKPSP
jgi:DNA-binding NtrC family response regulator